MKNVIAFNLAKVEEQDAKFFRGLRDAFEATDAKFSFFSPQSHPDLQTFHHPFDWVIANIEKQYDLKEINSAQRLPEAQREIWIARIAQLSLQGTDRTPAQLLDILERFTSHVLDTFQPDLILSWNTLCPHSGVLGELARQRGCSVYLMERGFLNNSWFIEPGGLVGHSDLVERSYEDLIGADEQRLHELGRSYLGTHPFEDMSRYAQNRDPRFAAILEHKKATARPLIGFFPPDDLSLGFIPAGIEDQRKHVPLYDSSLDAAIALAETAPECDVVFKPHPSFRELDLPEQVGNNLFVIDHDYRDVMAHADVVASTGSGLIVTAMAQGQPVLQMGRDQFSFKNITYDAQTEIRPALEAALAHENLENRRHRFTTFIGYALTSYLTSGPNADAAFRRPVDTVRDIMFDCFGEMPNIQTAVRATHQYNDDRVNTNRAELFQTLGTDTQNRFLVDFDHTLMFANSTELFLQQVRPNWGFVVLHWLVTWLIPWKALARRGIQQHEFYDPIRITCCLFFMPWTLWSWSKAAPGYVERMVNFALLERLTSMDSKRIAIVSLGHPWLLRPLLNAMGLKDVQLICGHVLPGPHDIRRRGKLATCAQRISEFSPDQSIIITDSRDDDDLLNNTRKAFLIDWQDRKNKADPLAHYFPFVLTDRGKYAGANVVKRHRFQEDFPVILAAFALAVFPALTSFSTLGLAEFVALIPSALLVALSCLCYFISFNAVYEIGYWENDFVAAQKEATPNVSPNMQKFKDYPLQPAVWIWATVLGALGTALAQRAGITSPLLAPFVTSADTLSSGAEFCILLLIWCGVLAAQRGLFHLHNHAPERHRIYTFWSLHAFKLLCYGLIFPTSVAGVVLIIAQVYRHWPNYLIYRFQGDRAHTPKYGARAFFFLAFSLVILFAVPLSSLVNMTWLAGVWLFLYRQEYFTAVLARLRLSHFIHSKLRQDNI
ncbi:hypothetical protein KMP13_11575 [Epibacterium ulvae]|uniref:hypothetical protein n=1 Tax=Epibacterium ulvae TaxID=1156985 RepID=UPI001BFBF728|nr:hypothetical protein [Epibacterium ulvae]MBT8154526.1 hypothetical protein [Epibacterium ulvae]